jgi:biopolymer transport protein ExbD
VPVIVTITKDGRLYLGTKPVSPEKLKHELEAAADRDRRAVLSMRADRDTSNDTIVKVFRTATAVNIQQVFLITNPIPKAHGQRNDKKLSSDTTPTKAVSPADRLAPKSVLALTISIANDGRIYLESQPVLLENLRHELEAAVGRDPRAVLSVRVDREASLETTVKVLDAARATNIAQVVLTTSSGKKGAATDEEVLGGMNLGEEYRRNNPFISYAVDRNFLDYFGERGVQEIDKALKILNDLPPMSSQALGINEIEIIKLREDIARLQAQSRPAVSFEIKLLSLPPSAIPELALGMPISTNEQGHVTWKQTAAELSNLLRSLKQRDDIQTLLTPRVTTYSGRKARVETSDIRLTPDLKLSTSIDLVPYVKGDQIDLTVNAAFTWSGRMDQLNNQPDGANAGGVFSINAVGYVNYHPDSTRVTLANDQSAIIYYPTKSFRGQIFLIVVSAKMTQILDSTAGPAPTNRP